MTAHDDAELSRAWNDAAVDLGLVVEAPFVYPPGSGHVCVALVRNFGSAKGTIVARFDDAERGYALRVGKEVGYFCSSVNPAWYERYDRERFIEALDDWGWFGPSDQTPPWYNGAIHR